MDNNEYLVGFVLLVFVLFGLWNFISAPILVRRFYNNTGFTNNGKSTLSNPGSSHLLAPLATSDLYSGQYRNYYLEHCKAYPKARRKFTLSKKKRKYNQSHWAISRIESDRDIPAFCVLPLSEPETLYLMLEDPGVEFEENLALSNRYHVRTDNPEQIKHLMTSTIRNFLLSPELISIESIDNQIIVKRTWPVEKFEARLSAELDVAVDMVEQLAAPQPAHLVRDIAL